MAVESRRDLASRHGSIGRIAGAHSWSYRSDNPICTRTLPDILWLALGSYEFQDGDSAASSELKRLEVPRFNTVDSDVVGCLDKDRDPSVSIAHVVENSVSLLRGTWVTRTDVEIRPVRTLDAVHRVVEMPHRTLSCLLAGRQACVLNGRRDLARRLGLVLFCCRHGRKGDHHSRKQQINQIRRFSSIPQTPDSVITP